MIKIFDSGATQFETMGFGALNNVYNCVVDTALSGTYELNMEMGVDDENFQYVQIGNIIVCKPNLTDFEQPFVIEQIEKTIEGTMSIYATQICQYRTKLIPVAPFSASDIQGALSGVISNSLETNIFNLTSPRTTQVSYTLTEPRAMRDILGGVEGSLLDVYGGEYIFDNFNIQLVNRRGSDKGFVVMYGINMDKYTETSDFSWTNSITGVLPFYKNDDDGSVLMGDIQYSLYADQFPFKKTVCIDFTDKFGEEDTPSVQALNDLAVDYLAKKGLPSINIEVSFADVSTMPEYKGLFNEIDNVELGDTVTINNTYFDRVFETRIQELKYNVLLDRYDSIVLGDAKGTINDAIRNTVQIESSGGGGLAADELIDKGTLTATVSGGSITYQTLKYAKNVSGSKFMIWGAVLLRGTGASNKITVNLGLQVKAPSQALTIRGSIATSHNLNTQALIDNLSLQIDTSGNVTFTHSATSNNTYYAFVPVVFNIADFEGV